jgi:AcrR family transcriptional regulator
VFVRNPETALQSTALCATLREMPRAQSQRRKREPAPVEASERRARRVPRQDRSQHTVDAILTATKALVVKHGLDALNTNRVARVAGVSIGSLYQYFPSKRALVAELRRRHQSDGMALFRSEAAALVSAPLPEAIRRFVEQMLAVHRQDTALHRALELEGGQGRLAASEQDALKLIRGYMELHRAEIGVADLDQAALIVGLTVEAITHGTVLERPELLADPSLVDGVVRMLLAYLQPPAAAAHGALP